MLQRHKFPARETTICIVKPPLPAQDTNHPIGTGKLHLNITPPLMVYPNPNGDMLQSLKVGIKKHRLSDFIRGDNTIFCNERSTGLDHRRRVGGLLVRACGAVGSFVLTSGDIGRRSGRKINRWRVIPRLGLDELPFFSSFNEQTCVKLSITICRMISAHVRYVERNLHL